MDSDRVIAAAREAGFFHTHNATDEDVERFAKLMKASFVIGLLKAAQIAGELENEGKFDPETLCEAIMKEAEKCPAQD